MFLSCSASTISRSRQSRVNLALVPISRSWQSRARGNLALVSISRSRRQSRMSSLQKGLQAIARVQSVVPPPKARPIIGWVVSSGLMDKTVAKRATDSVVLAPWPRVLCACDVAARFVFRCAPSSRRVAHAHAPRLTARVGARARTHIHTHARR
jgi:hypothetical protein